MSDNPPPESNVSEELRNLGKNLLGALQAAWEAPEFKQFQQDLSHGLGELGSTVKKEVNNFNDSPAGQQFRTDVNQFGERIRTGETQEKVRGELVGALKIANSELEKVIQRWSATSAQPPTTESTAEDRPAQPGTDSEAS
jgi:hypothetical protein